MKRVAVARTRGREIVIEHAFAVDLMPRDVGTTAADVNVGEQIAAALAARNVGRCETLVAVGRASIELRGLSIPPSPPEELPDMVRFQALRQFTGIGEDWPMDFVPLESTEADSLSVLAATISPEIVEQIRHTCRAAELTPRRLVLRPFAAASLLRRRADSAPGSCRMMVDLLADEADLTVVVDQQVALVPHGAYTSGNLRSRAPHWCPKFGGRLEPPITSFVIGGLTGSCCSVTDRNRPR